MWILWVTAIIKPIEVPKGTHIDIIINLIATILLFVTMFTWKRHILERWEWMFMVGIYIAYMGYIISISI
jgi:Ca2+/Na+ antiporter